ncbi:MAG: Holliday junction resolvase RuvX [Myxococcota bacterium]
MIRLLGLDVGTVRVGVALSDPLGLIAQPFEVIHRRKSDPFDRVVALVDQHEVQRVVIGNPLQLDGEVGPAAIAIAEFAGKLRERLSVPVELWDERLSTAQAEREMIAAGMRREKRRQRIDKVAAALILQSYLDARSVSG